MHRLYIEYLGYNQEFDLLLEKVTSLPTEGAGYCFFGATRDLSFRGSEEVITKAKANVDSLIHSNKKMLPKILRVRVIRDEDV